MIHYHGTPLSSLANCARVLSGRHGLASFATAGSFVGVLAEVCQSFVLDNGAFSAWRSGSPVENWEGCYAWFSQWLKHPNCDWALIPDVIDGDESANDELVESWPFSIGQGVPVWHYHESFERLEKLVATWPRVALGSSGEWPEPGTGKWWQRTGEAMRVCCDRDGFPRTKLHGLRMLNPDIFGRIPLASADSCNAGRNCGREADRWSLPADAAAEVIIRRIELSGASPCWRGIPESDPLDLFAKAM